MQPHLVDCEKVKNALKHDWANTPPIIIECAILQEFWDIDMGYFTYLHALTLFMYRTFLCNMFMIYFLMIWHAVQRTTVTVYTHHNSVIRRQKQHGTWNSACHQKRHIIHQHNIPPFSYLTHKYMQTWLFKKHWWFVKC